MSIRRKEKPRFAPFTNKKKWGGDGYHNEQFKHDESYLYELVLSNIVKQVAKERIIDQYGDYDKGVEIIKAQLGWQKNASSRLERYEQFNIYKTLGGYGGLRTKWVAQRLCEYIYVWQLKYLSDQCLLNHSYLWRMKGFRWWK